MTTDNISDTKLKLPESKLSAENPFQDDVLKRSGFAENLTNLVKDQTEPFTVSLHGQWGTGKTFLLERWQKEMEKKGIHSIYFNAWADDFCDDPLVAIIGQLSEFLNKKNPKRYKSTIDDLKKCAKPLLIKTVAGTINNFIGVDLSEIADKLSENIMDEYSSQSKSRDELKKCLKEIACQVKEDTDHPLVFIIDELDRCRPLFAIELLERVKHIFEIPNMVFILGINKDELCKSIQSVYGEINAEDYLRRFFDMDILLPEADSRVFCEILMERYRVKEINTILVELKDGFPLFCGCLNLSLRDIEYCIRVLFFVGRNIKQDGFAYSYMIIIMAILRIKEKNLYQDFIQNEYLECKIMNFIYSRMIHKNQNNHSLFIFLNRMESFLYEINRSHIAYIDGIKNPIADELQLLFRSDTLSHPEYLSDRTKQLSKESIETMEMSIYEIQKSNFVNSFENHLDHISKLMDNIDPNS